MQFYPQDFAPLRSIQTLVGRQISKAYLAFCLLVVMTIPNLIRAQENIDDSINQLIRKHGLEQGEVMEIASWITDVYGPRLTGSPMLDKATEWAVKTLEGMQMKNVHLEEWGPFGRGWQLDHFELHCTAPSYFPLIAYPKAWSPSTDGEISGEVIYLDAASSKSLNQYKGKLKGKFVLLDTIRKVEEWFEAPAKRVDSEELLRLANLNDPTPRRGRNFRGSGARFSDTLWTFLQEEAPAAVIDRSYKGDLGTVFVSGASAAGGVRDEGVAVIPQLTMSIEHYNRLFRLLKKNITVSLVLDLKTRYTNQDGMEHNIIAEIPGTDLADEVVMFGAHFDSWHTSTGATDNGAGSAVMMEVARILQKTIEESGVKPRRTLRMALWTGEEQGLYGSRGYVRTHFANTDPNGNALEIYPAQGKISGYFNLDNGTGKIRGVHLQGNAAIESVFRDFLEPFQDLGATTLTLGNTGGTDHLSFDAVGIPGFQFIQDPIAYGTRTHHSNMDNWDHLVEDDLKQAATVIASFVWHTSQRNEMLPRKPIDEDLKQ
ncbi:MAG: M20/M25/M40 family metallo-hydrolase [Saprospiraceae bacterium]|nr:M20/M25/M40 family metallo-hydrolase [Saprospiraceae bacterium]